MHTDTNLGKLKLTLIIIGLAWSKVGEAFIDHGTLKSGGSMIWQIEQVD